MKKQKTATIDFSRHFITFTGLHNRVMRPDMKHMRYMGHEHIVSQGEVILQ